MDADENRSPAKYILYTKEIQHLLGGGDDEGVAQDEKAVRDRIREERLPGVTKRLQYFVDDVALLSSGGFLAPDEWADGWEDLCEVRLPGEMIEDVWTPRTELEGETCLGFVVGRTLRHLVADWDDRLNREELAWGVTLGLYGQPESRAIAQMAGVKTYKKFIEAKLDEEKEAYRENDEEIEKNMLAGRVRSSGVQSFPDVFADAGVGAVGRRVGGGMSVDGGDAAAENSGFDVLLLLDGIAIDQHETLAYKNLMRSITEDAERLTKTKTGHLEYEDVFCAAWKDGKVKFDERSNEDDWKVNREQIVGRLSAGNRSVAGRRVSEVMNNIGADETLEKWTDRPPLVTDESSGGSGREWVLTAYGYAVGVYLYVEDGKEKLRGVIGEVIAGCGSESDLKTILDEAVAEVGVGDGTVESE